MLRFADARCATASSRRGCSSRSSPSTGCSAAAAPSAGARPGAAPAAARCARFTDLRTGDIVVHEDHGIARFAGFDTKTVAGVTRDYLELEYAGGDRVFLPVDQLAQDHAATSAPTPAHPPLSKLGGKRWETMKARARRAAQELAGELLNLYAERKRRAGPRLPARHATGSASSRTRFPYRETPDQREAIEAVKADMEAARPMDRLICGDVGYGKTEVALRAAFKAADDGKQVLVLVPTTILAQQHYGTFSERLRDYPFTIEHRRASAPPPSSARRSSGFSEGKVDILIGTHRLLVARRAAEGPRPADRRRGAALRRQAEGAAAPAASCRST